MTSRMQREVQEIPAAAERLLSRGGAAVAAAARALAEADPPYLATVARGSSDHVATYLKYCSEILLGLPVASLGPSVASVYRAPLRLAGSGCVAVSQSGRSPDIVEMVRAAGQGRALTIALTNAPDSPLAAASAHVLDILAGPETSVAATKTFVNSAIAGLWLLALWRDDGELLAALRALPEALSRAVACDWAELRAALAGHRSLYTLGRGPAFAISNEAALKFKETCQVHAESYSSAELMHGPVSIVGEGFPVLGLAAADAAEPLLVDVAERLAEQGAAVFVTSARARKAERLEHVRTGHPLTDPIALIASFYANVEKLARARGLDPDNPRHLRKVTETL